MSPPSQRFFSVPAVAVILGLSERSVWRLIKAEELSATEFGRSTRIQDTDLEAFIARRRRKS